MGQRHESTGFAILTGGMSSRMGSDKAMLEWGKGTLLDHAILTALSLDRVANVYVVGERYEYKGRGATVLADDYPGTGPLGGIATALGGAVEEQLLVVAVDMPRLSTSLLEGMLDYRFEADALVPVVGGLQPLHAIYRRNCLAKIEAQLDAGAYRISDLFEHVEVAYLALDWIRKFDPDARSFENVNTPEEYERLVRAGDEERDMDR